MASRHIIPKQVTVLANNNISFTGFINGEYTITIMALDGSVEYNKEVSINSITPNNLALSHNSFSNGIKIIRVSEKQTMYTQKLLFLKK